MAPLALLLLCVFPASAQVNPLRAGNAFAPAGSVVLIDRRKDAIYAQAADVEAARTLLGGDRALVPMKFRQMPAGARAALLNGMEALARSSRDPEQRQVLQRLIVTDELEHIEPRVRGIELTPARSEAVLGQVEFRDVSWYHRFDRTVDPDGNGLPYGRAYPDSRIAHFVRGGGYKLPDIVGHHRVLFAHEYTHRLQFEGEFTFRGEPPAVATELLRGLELFGLEGLQRGMLDFVHEGVMGSFESGRAWLREPKRSADNMGFHHRGFLAGVAYELALRTGRWSDAWLFHRLVSSGTRPGDAAARLMNEGATP